MIIIIMMMVMNSNEDDDQGDDYDNDQGVIIDMMKHDEVKGEIIMNYSHTQSQDIQP